MLMISDDRWWQSMIVVDDSQLNIHKHTQTIQHISKHDPYTANWQDPNISQGVPRVFPGSQRPHRTCTAEKKPLRLGSRQVKPPGGPPFARGMWKKAMCIHVLPTHCKASSLRKPNIIYIYTYRYIYIYIMAVACCGSLFHIIPHCF